MVCWKMPPSFRWFSRNKAPFCSQKVWSEKSHDIPIQNHPKSSKILPWHIDGATGCSERLSDWAQRRKIGRLWRIGTWPGNDWCSIFMTWKYGLSIANLSYYFWMIVVLPGTVLHLQTTSICCILVGSSWHTMLNAQIGIWYKAYPNMLNRDCHFIDSFTMWKAMRLIWPKNIKMYKTGLGTNHNIYS